MKTIRRFLIVNGQGDCRIVSRRPNRMAFDEMAFPLNISVPDSWGQVYTDVPINLTLPEPDEPTVTIGKLTQLDDALDVVAGD